MKVELIRYTPDPDVICGVAAALCTNYHGEPVKALRGALASGHESVAEHASFTFLIEGVSRVLLAQITRHRLASFSVQSQRYAGLADNSVVYPESVCKAGCAEAIEAMKMSQTAYLKLIEMGVPEEDARFVVPQAICTKLMMTMNARELNHFLSLRTCRRAQWEIRELADRMLALVYPVAPVLFKDAGPGCVRGLCPEGRKSCGEPRYAEIERLKHPREE